MKALSRFLLVVGCFLLNSNVSGQTDGRRSGFTLLNEAVGGRSAAMADAFTSVSGDQTALYANPAAAAWMTSKDFVLSHHSSFADVRQGYAGWAYGNGTRGIGLSLGIHTAGDFEARTGPSAQPIGTFHLLEMNVGLTYAQRLGDRLSTGFSARVLHEDLASERASGFTIDAGVQYRVSGSFTLGAAIKHLGRMEALAQERVSLPREIRAGGSLSRDRLLVSAEARIQRFGENGFHIGGEMRPLRTLALRAGYVSGLEARDLVFGFGLRRGNWRFDYAFVPSSLDLGDSHRVSVGIR